MIGKPHSVFRPNYWVLKEWKRIKRIKKKGGWLLRDKILKKTRWSRISSNQIRNYLIWIVCTFLPSINPSTIHGTVTSLAWQRTGLGTLQDITVTWAIRSGAPTTLSYRPFTDIFGNNTTTLGWSLCRVIESCVIESWVNVSEHNISPLYHFLDTCKLVTFGQRDLKRQVLLWALDHLVVWPLFLSMWHWHWNVMAPL